MEKVALFGVTKLQVATEQTIMTSCRLRGVQFILQTMFSISSFSYSSSTLRDRITRLSNNNFHLMNETILAEVQFSC